MHGLINRAIEGFVRNTYGSDLWQAVIGPLGFGFTEFEAMLVYEHTVTERILARLSNVLARPLPEILEDLGTYLVSHPELEALRRLLRFGGMTFEAFLHSLDDLPKRAQLAVSDLHLPALELREHTACSFSLTVRAGPDDPAGFGYVMMGLLRAMADDYGALVFLEHKGQRARSEVLSIELLESCFAAGRNFNLGVGGAS